MTAYYNEIDRGAAAWLRELMNEGLIAPGVVDERSIEDVTPNDLKGFTQCHFFAGIGVWSRALRGAGWPDDRPAWTGSCPCQPFSAAGKRKGTADERHLWPAWQWLIKQCAPPIVFGEQVDSKDGIAWLDAVCADMEGEGYAIAPFSIPACGFGAPHKRQRLWFVAESLRLEGRLPDVTRGDVSEVVGRGEASDVADGSGERWERRRAGEESVLESLAEFERLRDARGAVELTYRAGGGWGDAGVVSRAEVPREGGGEGDRGGADGAEPSGAACELVDARRAGPQGRGECSRAGAGQGLAWPTGPVNGFWKDAEWVWCRDQRFRATKPGIFPLAHGVAGRVGLLRGAGNAIVAPAAEGFIGSYMEAAREEAREVLAEPCLEAELASF